MNNLDDGLMPLNPQEFLKLAFSHSKKPNIPHMFNKEKGVAGKEIYYDL
jgi:hypothetical protein